MLRKKGIALPACILFLALGLSGCSEEEEQKAVVQQVMVSDSNPLIAEQTIEVTYGEIIKRELYDGVVTPYTEELTFSQDGTFLEYEVAMGEEVTEGQILAKTDNTGIKEQIKVLEEQIAKLTAQYNYRLATLKNQEDVLKTEMEINYLYLEDESSMSPKFTQICQTLGRQDKSLKSNQLEQKHLTEEYNLELPYLQSQLKELKKQVNGNDLKAPFAGTVVQLRSMAGGDKVNAETPYVAVADTSRYIVTADYARSNTIEKAERVYVFINGKEYEATYLPMDSTLYSKLLAAGGTVFSEYEIQADGSFDFGQAAKVVIVVESKKDVLRVPYTAVRQEASRRYCYVKHGEEREKVYIDTGLFDGMYYEVKSGLTEGDEVFIE